MKQEFSEYKNITIGDQEFQKVGEIKSEPTKSHHTPKSYDLYQDVDSGSLVGKLPVGYLNNNFEAEIKNYQDTLNKLRHNNELQMDLSRFTEKDIVSMLSDENIKIYGAFYIPNYKSNDKKSEIISVGELQVTFHPELKVDGKYSGYIISPKNKESSYGIRIENIGKIANTFIKFNSPDPGSHLPGSRRIDGWADFLKTPGKYGDLSDLVKDNPPRSDKINWYP